MSLGNACINAVSQPSFWQNFSVLMGTVNAQRGYRAIYSSPQIYLTVVYIKKQKTCLVSWNTFY